MAAARQLFHSVKCALFRADDHARRWLRVNARVLAITADTLHSVALLTPSANAEIRAQLAATLVSIVTIYRDYPASSALPSRRRLTLVALNIITAVQLLVEMLATRQPNLNSNKKSPHQLTALTVIEAAKGALRLSLLADRQSNQHRMLTAADQRLPEAPAPPVCTCGMQDVPGVEQVSVAKGIRTSRAILKPRKPAKRVRPLSSHVIAGLEPPPSELRHYRSTTDPLLEALFTIAYERRANWVVRMFMPDVACEACSADPPPRPSFSETIAGIQNSLSALTPAELAAEVAYIVRPFIHLILLRRYGWRSWKAWSAALVLDLGARTAMAAPGDDSDEEERRRRMAQLILYLGRSPMFDLILRRFIKKFTNPLRKVPLVGGVASSAIEWMTLLQQYWFYTSGS